MKDNENLAQMTIEHRVVNRGIGRAIDSAGDRTDEIYEVIIDVLQNSRFECFAYLTFFPSSLHFLTGTGTISGGCPNTNAYLETPLTRQ